VYKCSAKCSVVDTLVGKEIPEVNSGREGEARESILGKVRDEARGPATRCKKSVAPRLKNGALQKRQFLKNDGRDDAPVDLRQ
jgi:hypothetical protein